MKDYHLIGLRFRKRISSFFHRQDYLLILFSAILFTSSCKDENSVGSTNGTTSIDNFYPDSGGIATKFIITGQNFGTDLKQIRVYFNEKQAKLLQIKDNAIYGLVPKQPGDESVISVVTQDDSISFPGKKFKYNIASSVTTVSGKAKEAGGVDGTLAQATFNLPRYVGVDNEDNIFVVDNQIYKLRLLSQKENRTLTLTSQLSLSQPVFSADKRVLYFTTDNDQYLFKFDAETQWILERIGKYDNAGYHHSLAMDPRNPEYIFTRKNSGPFLRINLNKPNILTTKTIGDIKQVSGGQNGHLVFNPVDNHFYCANNADNMIYKIKVADDYNSATVIPWAGSGVGWADGPVDQAKFNYPRGIAVDLEGNIIVADQNNHCIRKISLDGIVTTIAGTPRSAGYVDGLPAQAKFNQPTGVAVDRNDMIYIADQNNHCIRKLAIE
ncbi:IPT/TIG domain-containing protein [Sphingobacterium kyonggiense]|uniref:IPT/TIG domain-containing protein n=1 Tax=Sphingobacterium kyonggiense TaxID=714075 RepID=UPI0031CDEDB5